MCLGCLQPLEGQSSLHFGNYSEKNMKLREIWSVRASPEPLLCFAQQFIITSYILGLFSGVPDYCEKMHNVAKSFHQQKQQSESSEASRYDQISSALSNKKQTIAV